INVLIKTGRKKQNELGKVFHFDLYGIRKKKYKFLIENSIHSISFTELPIRPPNYFMVNKDFEAMEVYKKGFLVSQLFPVNSVGIVTARDAFTIKHSKEEVISTINSFLSLPDEDARRVFDLGRDVRDWKVE